MGNTVQVGKTGELKDGSMKEIVVEGRKVLLARVGDKYFAAASRCPHMGGNLARGNLEGSIVTCPVHGSQFDLSDGHVVRWTNWSGLPLKISKLIKKPRPIAAYKARVEGDKILVEI